MKGAGRSGDAGQSGDAGHAGQSGQAFGVVVTDLDRTFTAVDLSLDPEALATARRLRQAGVVCILATGRRAQDLAGWPALQEAFDGFVLECGAVWGRWGDLRVTSPHTSGVHAVAAALAAQGCDVEEGLASCSLPADWSDRLEARPERPLVSVQPNRDRIDVVPAGVDKAAGLRRLLDHLGLAGARLLTIGDGENDLPIFAIADRAVAVANAAAVVRQAADLVAPRPAAAGFVWAVRSLAAAPLEEAP
jgi:hydroxymethylpyrimidine pyrophosphatase-like HAD family hydrolase